ncbi:NAD-dependent epimerase/dehydratase family protein [Aeromonas sp. Prich7-2]|uniref:NAD-dependent epimerase/dehydratase family protein n=1 Tax=Aeromonas sp. Prich7-2 TaxID=2823361 RepID=UPI001B322CD4|nr:NAD-dependent epimerase/dehydratase family protein [Aeromonas sp. Prich7-2]MBP4060892.1 NAD-dependent epimerase/dehydratase family protein [Aeromonas sp. Prich7-2]
MDFKNKRLLITGANGFVGRKLVEFLRSKGAITYLFSRTLASNMDKDLVSLDDISQLKIDVVIHLAAKAHVIEKKDSKSLDDLYLSNVDLPLSIATESLKAGAKRFIFISSIGVLGVSNNHPFTASSITAPHDLYSASKLDAELKLWSWSLKYNCELVVIRPPLVYGPRAPGNFGRLSVLVQKNLPLPLGAIHNKRSLVALDNLVDLIATCVVHPKAANQTFLVSDDQDLSTTELITLMARAAGKKPCLIPFPARLLFFMAKLVGKAAVVDRLCSNLQVDISHTKDTLGWKPPISVEEGIRRCFNSVEC